MASAAELSALDKGAALLDELYDLLRVRLDDDLRSLTRLRGNSARAMPDGRLNLRVREPRTARATCEPAPEATKGLGVRCAPG
jgi:hypothetical protein